MRVPSLQVHMYVYAYPIKIPEEVHHHQKDNETDDYTGVVSK